MRGERVERRLAAILAADVAGHSRLMGRDEAGTLARLRALSRELIAPKIAEHKGRIVKTGGDGMLVEFTSIVEVVACGGGVQHEVAQRSAGTAEDQSIQLRIGIDSGDAIVEDGDIHGDGVAARLEGIAEPDGICLSEDAYRQVQGKVDVGFVDIGEQRLKNIACPVRVDGVSLCAISKRASPALALPDKPSIAVLPFQNISGDPEQEYCRRRGRGDHDCIEPRPKEEP